MQCFLHPPSQFIQTQRANLLPEWSQPVRSLLIVLQPSLIPLVPQTSATEIHKQDLRQRFLEFGGSIARHLHQHGYLAEVFDPRTGLPMLSRSGDLRLDDVAVVRACLGYDTMIVADCAIVIHPLWGEAVYPSTVVSSATSDEIATIKTLGNSW